MLSSQEYMECCLDRSRMLEYFPHVKWLIIWKKTLFYWLEVKEGASSYAEETTSVPGEKCRLIYATCKDQAVFQGN